VPTAAVELDEKIGVAGFRIKIRPARRGAENFQPPHAVAAAEGGQFFAAGGDFGVHGGRLGQICA